MESSRPGALPVNEPRRFPVAAVVFGVVVAVIAGWITIAAVTDRGPEETVEAYLDALTDKDVEGALALVTRYGYGVPYGDDAAFLTPEAISDDWWVVSVTEVGREYSSARVKAVLAGPGGTSEGEFAVDEVDDEWLLSDPFVQVRFPGSPLSFIRVNDKIVTPQDGIFGIQTYTLFPGTYRFYQSVPNVVTAAKTDVVAAFPPPEDSRTTETTVVPGTLTAGKRAVTQVQKVVRQRIDECAEFTTPAPADNCPFATDGDIDTVDGRRVTDPHSLTWTVERYPVVTMADDRPGDSRFGFGLHADEPGTVTLSGTGRDTEGNQVPFTVTCDIDVTNIVATVDVNGDVDLAASRVGPVPAGNFNTCRRNA